MFDLLKNYLVAHTRLAKIRDAAVCASLDDRELAIHRAQKKRAKKQKAKRKAKRDARELTETIAGFAPLFGVAGAVIGHLLGKQEGAAIGERIGRTAQEKIEDAAGEAQAKREAAEERYRADEEARRRREEATDESRVQGLCFLIRAKLEQGNLTTSQVLDLCKMSGTLAQIETALYLVGDATKATSAETLGEITTWTLKGAAKNG